MSRHRSLTTRAFLYASLPMCFVLVGGGLVIHAAVKEKVTAGLKTSLSVAEAALAKTNADYESRASLLLAVLSEDAGLKAGFGLFREARTSPQEAQQARNTIEAQLLEWGRVAGYDLLLAADAAGHPVTGVVRRKEEFVPLDPTISVLPASGLVPVGENFYESRTLPVNLGEENLGNLTVGRKFDTASWNDFGYAALLDGNKIILSSLPRERIPSVESQLRRECAGNGGCEIEIGGEAFLALPVQRPDWGNQYRLFSLQSIDKPMSEFMRGFTELFLLIGAGGVLAVFLVSAVGSRYVSNPITMLIARLEDSERTGTLRADFPTESAVREVNHLAHALNRAGEAAAESQRRLDEASLEFVETMAQALDARDAYTAGHSDRVSANSTAIAQAMGLSPEEVEIIRIGAKLHDIGKIGIPDAILQKPGRLTAEEYARVKLHPQMGKRILEKVARFQDYLPIVELHHEDFDGRGYPYGLKGEEIPLGVRIVHVADVYDALTSNRTYRNAMPQSQVLEMMQSGSGTQFDPEVIRAFRSLLIQRLTLESLLEGIAGAAPETNPISGEMQPCVAAVP